MKFKSEELETIARLCQKWDVLAITDEIYEHLLYDGAEHVSMLSIEGMRDRTAVVNGMSKTYSVTGWRVGYVIASPRLTEGIRKMHDFLTVGAPAPLQEAGVVAMGLGEDYYKELGRAYLGRRDRLLGILAAAGFDCLVPRGAYYVMADVSQWGYDDDVAFAHFLLSEIGVAAVPGSSFFFGSSGGRDLVRFTFCKSEATFAEAEARLGRLRSAGARRA
jgi:aminotransferase